MKRLFLLLAMTLLILGGCQTAPEPTPEPDDWIPTGSAQPELTADIGDIEPNFREWERVTLPTQGLSFVIPPTWELERLDDRYLVRTETGAPVIEVGLSTELPLQPSELQSQLRVELSEREVQPAFVDDQVISTNPYVYVEGDGFPDCRYVYLPLQPSFVHVFRLGPALCDAEGDLSELGFGFLRSVNLSLPTE